MNNEIKKTGELTNGQLQAIAAFDRGDPLCVTGPAGVGKSYLISEIVRLADSDYKSIGLTATTGTAALEMGGKTLHSYLGIGLGVETAEALHKKIMYNRECVDRWRTDILVIDEISMLTATLFDKIEHIARLVRRNSRFFGGIQLVLIGDLFQLAPVNYQEHGYITNSAVFQKNFTKDNVVILSEIIRQKDLRFQQFLNDIRLARGSNELSADTLNLLAELSEKVYPETDIRPTRLYSHRADVTIENIKHLASLQGELYTIQGNTRCVIKRKSELSRFFNADNHIKKMDQACNTSNVLEFKVGAQVMITKNIDPDAGIVNGSRGVITSISQGETKSAINTTVYVKLMSGEVYPVSFQKWEMEVDDNVTVIREQLPLMLAYAFTIHKSQGATLDCVLLDIGKIFEYGQVYTGLSRCRTLSGTYLFGYNKDVSFKLANPDLLKFIEALFA